MIARVLEELGPWAWWVLGLALLAAEIVMPGVFLVWIGIAAIVTGAFSLLLWNMSIWHWQVQILVFALVSVAAVLAGRRLLSRFDTPADAPLLNRRTDGLVGRTAILEEPIAEGRGRIRLGDTTWPVDGPDLPIGARVRVVTGSSGRLTVESA